MKCFINRLFVVVSVCLVIALLSVNAVFVTAECPNYGTANSDCPSASPAYNNGPCAGNAQVCPTRGELAHGGPAAYQLVEQEGSQIVSNDTPICYVICTCSLADNEDANGNTYKVCKPSFQTFAGYAYVSGPCPG